MRPIILALMLGLVGSAHPSVSQKPVPQHSQAQFKAEGGQKDKDKKADKGKKGKKERKRKEAKKFHSGA